MCLGRYSFPSPLLLVVLNSNCIQEALIKFSGKWQEQLQAQLVRSCDPSSYVDGLLGQGLCFCNGNAPDLKGQFTLQQQSSQMEVRLHWDQGMSQAPSHSPMLMIHAFSVSLGRAQILNRAIEALVRAPGGDKNVLCLGYRKVRKSSASCSWLACKPCIARG